ncbi:MAG TPA: class C beta-lactamase-related serine hydrolase [Anaerolineae bacterium]|nr:class C beta-lactamase-related serine hydrolase [Anaerolineae bacterium]
MTPPETLNRIMQSGVNKVFPAAVLSVVQNGQTLFNRAYGYLDPETRRRPTQPGDLFDLASLTKLFTLTAFMTLVDAKKVSLQTPVADILPQFGGKRPVVAVADPLTKKPLPVDPEFAGQSVNANKITFWHLLTHTSGLPAWRGLYAIQPDAPPIPAPAQIPPKKRAARIAAIYTRNTGFACPPDAKFIYSDLGLILLGEAVSKLMEAPLDACITRAILTPLNLPGAFNPLQNGFPAESIAPTEICAWRKRRCRGEAHDENAAGLGGVAGHAGLFAPAKTVSALGQLFLNGGVYKGKRILSRQSVTLATRQQVNFNGNPRGLGWQLRPLAGASCGNRFSSASFGHTGFTGTSLWVDPERQLVVTLLTNRVYYGRNPAGITRFRPRLHNALSTLQ